MSKQTKPTKSDLSFIKSVARDYDVSLDDAQAEKVCYDLLNNLGWKDSDSGEAQDYYDAAKEYFYS